MPKFTLTAPDGKKYSVTAPEGMSKDDILSKVQSQLGYSSPQSNLDKIINAYMPQEPAPSALDDLPISRSLSGAFGAGLKRAKREMGSAITNVVPALVADLFGQEKYAKKKLDQYAEEQAAIEEGTPKQFQSYKDVKGIGDAATYLAELTGEQLPLLKF